MKCLIVAAGRGTRLQGREQIKPLVPLRGVPLIRHVMDRALLAGIDGFVVVSGCRGDEVRGALDGMAAADGIEITHVVNDAWQRANGISVLAARGVLEEPFVLAMCDHVVDPGIVAAVMAADLPAGGVVLGVDRNLGNPSVDPDDVTRVRTLDGRIVAIGKLIPDYDCYDVGVFLCSGGMYSALAASQALGDDSISGAMNVLAAGGLSTVCDVAGRPWIDVDDDAAFAQAERLLESGGL